MPEPPVDAHLEEGGGDRLGPGRPGRRGAAQSRRPQRDRVREVRSHRRPAALRHPRVQDGEARPRSPPRPDGGRGRGVPHRHERRRRRDRRTTCGATSTPSCWPAAPASRATSTVPGPRAHGRALRDGVPDAAEPALPGRRRVAGADRRPITAAGKHVVIIGGGDTGADCLGTVHRQGARSVTPARAAADAAQRSARRQPVAAVAEHLPHLVGARRGRRARLCRRHHAS